MKENPYSKMLEIMKGQGKSYEGVLIGEVISTPPNLVIKVGDLQVDKDNILIADYLLKDHAREVRTDLMSNIPSKQFESGTTTVNSSHSHDIAEFTIHNTKIYTEDTLKENDRVAVLTTPDKQTYIIIARLVSL